MTIFCPSCGKELKPTRENKDGKGTENYAFSCSCNPHAIFARKYNGFLRSVYFVDPSNFEGVWAGNTLNG